MNQSRLCSEAERLAALYKYHILDSPRETAFDELTALAAEVFEAPIAVVNFIDTGRQWFKAEVGLGVRETPLESSFCVHALLEADLLVVPDTSTDKRFADNPLVLDGPRIRFYAGALLHSDDGYPIGTLCILDYRAREFDSSQQRTLRVLANQVMAQLEQRRLLAESEANRAELVRLNQKLMERDSSKDQFLAMVSHELRNPLSPIVSALELIKIKGPLDPVVERSLGTIGRQVVHLSRLVDDLLDASRVSAGKISLQLKTVSLAEVVRTSLEMVRAAALQKKHDLEVRLPEQEILLNADTMRICQLFSNLLNNAIRYTEPGGHITLSAKLLSEQRLQIVVADNGMGIAPDYIERVFESFVQAPQNGGISGGLGIGLHLCKHIVQLHKGVVFARSEGTGQGSEFIVELPVVRLS